MEQKIGQYGWLKYQQLSEQHLWIVLRLFQDEYVVHLYNSQDDDHYYGIYCGQDREKAEQEYQDKLAYYQGEIRGSKPSNLLEALSHIWLSSLCNIADIKAVIEALENYHYEDSANFIRNNQYNYANILEDLSEYVREHQNKSLAQQLAEEMGWEVIVD